jgi:coronin-2
MQIEWHPVAQSVLFSAGADGLVVVWTVANGGAILNVIDCHPEAIQCLSLNRDGSLIATTCRDRKLRCALKLIFLFRLSRFLINNSD